MALKKERTSLSTVTDSIISHYDPFQFNAPRDIGAYRSLGYLLKSLSKIFLFKSIDFSISSDWFLYWQHPRRIAEHQRRPHW